MEEHLQNKISKASRMLGFIKQNFWFFTENIKKGLYTKTFVSIYSAAYCCSGDNDQIAEEKNTQKSYLTQNVAPH